MRRVGPPSLVVWPRPGFKPEARVLRGPDDSAVGFVRAGEIRIGIAQKGQRVLPVSGRRRREVDVIAARVGSPIEQWAHEWINRLGCVIWMPYVGLLAHVMGRAEHIVSVR